MKSILISINPQHAVNILNGSKTLELRKSVPKDFVGWVYMYVTKGKPTIYDNKQGGYVIIDGGEDELLLKYRIGMQLLNGSIVARWWFDGYSQLEYIEIHDWDDHTEWQWVANGGELLEEEISKKSQLSLLDIDNYFKPKHDGYAWHISKLEILDKPMELGEFYKEDWYKTSDYFYIPLTRSPQSWQYVWVKEK